jgi:hypothetical protein
MQYKYFYTKRTAAKIRSFYRNVAKKYQHTYSYEDMERKKNHGDRFLNETMKWISLQKPVPMILSGQNY